MYIKNFSGGSYMNFIYIGLIILLYSFQTLFCKLFSDRYPGKKELVSPVFCVIQAVFITLATYAFNGFQFHVSPLTLLFGILNGLILFGYNTSLIKAGTLGSYAFLNVCLLYGAILVPSTYGIIFLQEGITPLKILGIFMMLIACAFMNIEEIKLKDSSIKYYIFCILLFLFNGAYCTIIKMQTIYFNEEKQSMIMITFSLMGIIALINLITKERGSTLQAFKLNKKCLPSLTLCLISATLAINLLMYILPLIDTAVLYTVQNGGVLILSALYSVFLFKEKISLQKIFGILIAVISITILSI